MKTATNYYSYKKQLLTLILFSYVLLYSIISYDDKKTWKAVWKLLSQSVPHKHRVDTFTSSHLFFNGIMVK